MEALEALLASRTTQAGRVELGLSLMGTLLVWVWLGGT